MLFAFDVDQAMHDMISCLPSATLLLKTDSAITLLFGQYLSEIYIYIYIYIVLLYFRPPCVALLYLLVHSISKFGRSHVIWQCDIPLSVLSSGGLTSGRFARPSLMLVFHLSKQH